VESKGWFFVKGVVPAVGAGVTATATATTDVEENYDGEDEKD
jgi:hypothetical protein